MVEDSFAHTHRLGCNLNELILFDILQAFLKRHNRLRHNAGFLVSTRCTDVGKLLSFAYVDDEVVVVNMFAHYLTSIHILTRINEELTTILQLVDGVGKGITRIHRDHRPIDTTLYLTFIGLVLLEAVSHDGLALRSSEHIGTQTDNAARGNIELDIHTLALIFHRGHFAFSTSYHINHLRGKFLRHVNGEFLDRFTLLSVNFLIDHLRLTNL